MHLHTQYYPSTAAPMQRSQKTVALSVPRCLCQRTRGLAHQVSQKEGSRYRQHGRYANLKVFLSIIPRLLILDATGSNGTEASICGTAYFTFALVRSAHLRELGIPHRVDLSIVLPNSRNKASYHH